MSDVAVSALPAPEGLPADLRLALLTVVAVDHKGCV